MTLVTLNLLKPGKYEGIIKEITPYSYGGSNFYAVTIYFPMENITKRFQIHEDFTDECNTLVQLIFATIRGYDSDDIADINLDDMVNCEAKFTLNNRKQSNGTNRLIITDVAKKE